MQHPVLDEFDACETQRDLLPAGVTRRNQQCVTRLLAAPLRYRIRCCGHREQRIVISLTWL